jgi:hypothetical protein
MLFQYQLLIFIAKLAARFQFWRASRLDKQFVKSQEKLKQATVAYQAAVTSPVEDEEGKQFQAAGIAIDAKKQVDKLAARYEKIDGIAEKLLSLAIWLDSRNGRLVPGLMGGLQMACFIYVAWKLCPDKLQFIAEWLQQNVI